MGKHQIITGCAPGHPLSLLSQAVPMLTRGDLEALTERLIDRLDMLDGDPDAEEDDPAGQCDEDEINTGSGNFYSATRQDIGAGCPLSDPGGSDLER